MRISYLIQKKIDKNLNRIRERNGKFEKALVLVPAGFGFSRKSIEKLSSLTGIPVLNIYVVAVEKGKPDTQLISVTPQDIGWNGTIKDKNLSKILDASYDLLLDLTGIETEFEQLISSYPLASLRVGFDIGKPQFYDLMLESHDDIRDVIGDLSDHWHKLKFV